MALSLVPMQDRIIVQRVAAETVSEGGNIIIPETAKEIPMRAVVVAVGAGKVTDEGKIVPVMVKVGDTILMAKFAGTDIKIDGEMYVILREDEVLAIITAKENH